MTKEFIGAIDVYAEVLRDVVRLSEARDVLVCVHPDRLGSADPRFGTGPNVNVETFGGPEAGASCLPAALAALAQTPRAFDLAALETRLAQRAFDAYVLAWDYNWHSVARCLAAFNQASVRERRSFLAVVHGAGWPCGDRDLYRAPALIPQESRHPCAFGWQPLPPSGVTLSCGAEDDGEGAFAIHAGGPRNGVLCAVRDFLETRAGLSLRTIEPMGGLAVIYAADTIWSGRLETALQPFQNPLLVRVDADRVERLRQAAMWRERYEAVQGRYDDLLRQLAGGGLANMSVVPGQFYPAPRVSGEPSPPSGRG